MRPIELHADVNELTFKSKLLCFFNLSDCSRQIFIAYEPQELRAFRPFVPSIYAVFIKIQPILIYFYIAI